MNVIATIIMLTAATAVACALPSSVPGGGPGDSPDLQATVEILVEERLKDIQEEPPAPTPVYWPTPEDYSAYFYSARVPSRSYLRYFDMHAATYVAQACFFENEPTFSGFQSFLKATFYISGQGGKSTLKEVAESHLDWFLAESLAPKETRLSQECQSLFWRPNSARGAIQAAGLVKAAIVGVSGLGNPFLDGALKRMDNQATGWLTEPRAQEQVFIAWYWELQKPTAPSTLHRSPVTAFEQFRIDVENTAAGCAADPADISIVSSQRVRLAIQLKSDAVRDKVRYVIQGLEISGSGGAFTGVTKIDLELESGPRRSYDFNATNSGDFNILCDGVKIGTFTVSAQ